MPVVRLGNAVDHPFLKVAFLADLARLANPPVSKSCMSHRLKKLLEYKGD